MSQITRAYFDAEQEAVIVKRVDSATGNDITDYPQIIIQLGDAFSSGITEEPLVIKLREWDVCVQEGDTIVNKKAVFLSSLPYT